MRQHPTLRPLTPPYYRHHSNRLNPGTLLKVLGALALIVVVFFAYKRYELERSRSYYQYHTGELAVRVARGAVIEGFNAAKGELDFSEYDSLQKKKDELAQKMLNLMSDLKEHREYLIGLERIIARPREPYVRSPDPGIQPRLLELRGLLDAAIKLRSQVAPADSKAEFGQIKQEFDRLTAEEKRIFKR